jgi:FAD/FMN-containing dehydrogenase
VKASEDENADLFRGVRGGGGNFGIVTEFEFRLHPIGPQVVSGPIIWPAEEATNVLRFYRDWIADCPDELTTNIGQRKAAALPGIPADLVGKPVISNCALLRRPGRGGGEGGAPAQAVRISGPRVAALIACGAVAAAARLVELNPGGRRSPASS